jgi:hypothetical protein
LPDSPFDALLLGWAAPPVEAAMHIASPGAYRLCTYIMDARRLPKSLAPGHVLAVCIAGFALDVSYLGPDVARPSRCSTTRTAARASASDRRRIRAVAPTYHCASATSCTSSTRLPGFRSRRSRSMRPAARSSCSRAAGSSRRTDSSRRARATGSRARSCSRAGSRADCPGRADEPASVSAEARRSRGRGVLFARRNGVDAVAYLAHLR